ncbi:hypothetical protein F8M41_017240 [Gigaspora margarita]|uniref:Uncharacterized protein n=1 Tax=Gigaspora margarita TaxID=4874 RepID=A0A8H4ANB7_GIGMA|nr:hypothetical protein F8M41_017240 [Gigaspora margarita]
MLCMFIGLGAGQLSHIYLSGKLHEIDINDLTCDDPLSNGVGSNQFQLSENDFDLLVEEKAGIRRLSKSVSIKNICADFVERRDEFQEIYKLGVAEDVNVVHYYWVEQESDREQIVRDITECLMQEVEVTRNECQSVASKNRKAKLKDGVRGNRPNFIIRAFLGQKWNEIVYAESGKWNCNEDKILEDHNKLVRFCIDSYKEISKKHVKDVLRKNYIAFGINIAGENIIVHRLIRENGVKYYLPIAEAKIPLGSESVVRSRRIRSCFIDHTKWFNRKFAMVNQQHSKKEKKVSERSTLRESGR